MKKVFVFLLVLGIFVGGSGLAQATLSWQTEPVLGYSYNDATGNVQIKTSLTQLMGNDGNPAFDEDGTTPVYGPVIPHYSFPGDNLYQVGSSVSTYYINPTTWDPVSSHFYDPNVEVWSGSGVYLNASDHYSYSGVFSFLGSTPYDLIASSNSDFTGESFIMIGSGINKLWPEDVGNWKYTETWTDNVTGASISSTRNFTVGVPEPASMLLLGLGLVGLAGLRKRFNH